MNMGGLVDHAYLSSSSKGASWTSDASALAQVETLVKDSIAFLLTLESAGAKLVADVK
jgi:hypothetical protein